MSLEITDQALGPLGNVGLDLVFGAWRIEPCLMGLPYSSV